MKLVIDRDPRRCRRVRGHLLLLGTVLIGLALPGAPVQAEPAPAEGAAVMVAAAHPLASAAGVAVLREGGNAVDAAIAVAFALAVVEPYSSGLGGGGFAVLFLAATDSVEALDFRETAPAAAHRDMFLVEGAADPDLSRTGGLAVGTPGLVAGLWELHAQRGSLPWARLLDPAIDLARRGFLVAPMLQTRIAYHAERFNAAAREIFLPTDAVPTLGATLVQRDLARTLAAIGRHGPPAFYGGPTATRIVAAVTAAGGLLALEDLAAYRPVWRAPIHGSYRGLDIWSMPPPSSGGVHLIQMLNIVAGFDLAAAGYGSAAAWHPLVEVMRFAFADRSLYLGDADFVTVPVVRLTSSAYADSLRDLIRVDRALPFESIEGVTVVPAESNETTHLSVVDAAGNAVAMTLTINLGFGSGVVAPGTGVLLNDQMDDFVAAPGIPNAFGLVGDEANSIAPLKRPLSSMTPTIVLREGGVFMVTGSPGGSKIITTTLQSIIHVIDFGMDARQAVTVPRIHHQWYPSLLYHEPFGLSPDTRAILTELGHECQQRSPMGNVQLIVIDQQTGRRYGASDPRGMGRALGF